MHVKEFMPSNDIATASHRLRLSKSPNSPQIGSAFTNSSSAHPIGEDQKIVGGDNVRPAAPVKVASAEVLALVGACGWPSEIWLIALTTEVHSCGWPSEIWLTGQTTGVDVVGGVVVGLVECDEGGVVCGGDVMDVAVLEVGDEIGVVTVTGCGEETALLQ